MKVIFLVEERNMLQPWSALVAYIEEDAAQYHANSLSEDEEHKPLGRVLEIELIGEPDEPT